MDLGVSEVRPAVLAIDCHRGHLDPAVATMPVPAGTAERLIESIGSFLIRARQQGVPIIHAVTSYRDVSEIRSNPFWRTRATDPGATRKSVERHNLRGSIGCEVIPSLLDAAHDWVLDTKKRYDCFAATELDFVLQTHGINTLMIVGVNTNSCVLATAAAANSRDYATIVVEDCVDSMDGAEPHAAALLCIQTAIGWVMTSEQIESDVLRGAA